MSETLEDLAIKTFKRHNRISVSERVAHYGRWTWQNKVLVAMFGILGYIGYDFVNSLYHDIFVASSSSKDYLTHAKDSLDALAKSLGETTVQSPNLEKSLAVKNHYLEFVTNLKFAAQKVRDIKLGELMDAVSQNSTAFSGTTSGEQGLIMANGFRHSLNSLMEKYKASGTWLVYGMLLTIGSLIAIGTFRNRNMQDDEYNERRDLVKALDERVTYHLPKVFEKLKNFEHRDLLYKVATAYVQETGNPESALNFLFMSKDIPEFVVGEFAKEFGGMEFNYDRNGKRGGIITKDRLVKFVEKHVAELESSGFDFGLMNFDSIGGYESIKEELRVYASIFANGEDATRHGVEGVTGIIFEGPPGCGKTLLAEAYIHEALKSFGHKKRAHYKIVSAADLRSMWYSQNEQNIQKLYRDARRKAPYIIFIDEGEELFAKRGTGHSADTAGTNQFLTEIGGIKRSDQVLTIITTNRLEAVDEAARRYGRLGIHYKIDVPNEEGRKEITKIHLGRLGRPDLVVDFNYETFAAVTGGFTGADIAGIINRTFWERYRAINLGKEQPFNLTTEHFLAAAHSYHKTVQERAGYL